MISRFADSIPGKSREGVVKDGDVQLGVVPGMPSPEELGISDCEDPVRRTVAMPATKKRSKCSPATPGIRYWLVDTGCPVDLVGKMSMPKKYKDYVY